MKKWTALLALGICVSGALSAQTASKAMTDLIGAVQAAKSRSDAQLAPVYEVVAGLLAKGSLEAATSAGDTPLILVSLIGDTGLARALLDKGASALAKNADGMTALASAVAYGGDEALVRALVEAGSDLEARQISLNGQTPLMTAAYQGKSALVKYLLSRGAQVNAVKQDGWSVLLIAIDGGSSETVKLLLEAGADPQSKLRGATSALALARAKAGVASNGDRAAIVQLLLAHGARDEIPANFGGFVAGGGVGLSLGAPGSSLGPAVSLGFSLNWLEMNYAFDGSSQDWVLLADLLGRINVNLNTDGTLKVFGRAGGGVAMKDGMGYNVAAGAGLDVFLNANVYVELSAMYTMAFISTTTYSASYSYSETTKNEKPTTLLGLASIGLRYW